MVDPAPHPDGPAVATAGPSGWRRHRGVIISWVLVLAALAFVAGGVPTLMRNGSWIGLVIVGVVGVAVLAVYGTRKRVPMKYLLPGFLLLVAFQIYPVVYTCATAFTNYGDGHRVSKEEAIELIVENSVKEVQGEPRYRLVVAVPEGEDPATGDPVYLLQKTDGEVLRGDATGLETVPTDDAQRDADGVLTGVDGYTALSPREINDRQAELDELVVPVSEGVSIKRVGISEAFQGSETVRYDAQRDVLVDSATGREYAPDEGRFVATDGSGDAFPQGWIEGVGFDNFARILGDSTIRAGFVGVFTWNLVFAVLSVVSTFILGLLVALLLNDPRIKGRKLARSILILPYAIPGFVTALVWSSMYNRDFGLINSLTGLGINWLGDPFWAKVALLLANLWLGFPYMFLVCTGALQSIPSELKESAVVDGASPFRVLRSVTLPLLLVAVGPLLISSFAFNFNNFGLVYLLTGGGPFSSSDPTLGSSDLLISYAFRLAFGSTGANFGFASAVSIFIFIIVALMSWSAFRRTAALEEVN